MAGREDDPLVDDLAAADAAADKEEAAIWADFAAADERAADTPPEGRDDPDARFADEDADEQPQQPATRQAEPAQSDDIWAKAPPELRAAYEAERRRAQEYEHRIRSDDGRVARYQREVEELRRLQQPQGKKPAPLPDLKTSKFSKIKEDYPEIGEPLEEIFAPVIDELNDLRQARAADDVSRREAALSAEEARLKDQHADYVEVIAGNRATFDQWLGAQPRPIRDAYARNEEGIVDADEAGLVVGLFKQHIGVSSGRQPPAQAGRRQQLTDRRRRQLESAETPRHNAPPVVSGAPPDDADESVHWAFWEEVDRRKEAASRR